MSKKKQRFPQPRRSIRIVAVGVLALAALWGVVALHHYHVVAHDKARFTRAQKDVETVAGQVITTVGQPQDRKDGGKCRYAHQEFSKGPLTCEVYAYLAYGVISPGQVNSIAQKAASVSALAGSPWQFKAITEQPYQFLGGANAGGTFIGIKKLFDTETRSLVYHDQRSTMDCAISFMYFNSVARVTSYPNFNITQPQTLLMDVDCSAGALAEYFPVTD